MNAEQAVAATYQGNLVKCTPDDYPAIRTALQDHAGKMIDTGDGLRAMIALEEIRRLDKIHNFQLGGDK